LFQLVKLQCFKYVRSHKLAFSTKFKFHYLITGEKRDAWRTSHAHAVSISGPADMPSVTRFPRVFFSHVQNVNNEVWILSLLYWASIYHSTKLISWWNFIFKAILWGCNKSTSRMISLPMIRPKKKKLKMFENIVYF
jgi:hypothetical protein